MSPRPTSDVPDVSLVELAGFTFDMTEPEDVQLLELCLEALRKADKLQQRGEAT